MRSISRRHLLRVLAASPTLARAFANEPQIPIRPITKGPKYHWFGYYDKLQFDASSRYALGMEVGFQGRSPSGTDAVRIGMIDTEDGDRWTDLGQSIAWSWQQGCMLQWLPGSKSEIIWNDREGDHYVSHILDVKTSKKRTLPAPVYAISPDARWAVHPDFRRLHDTRPGYGYAGIPDPNRDVLAPEDSGIWKMSLETGKEELLFSVSDIGHVEDGHTDIDKGANGAKQWFNHLLFAPDGSKFCFLHRWAHASAPNAFITRLITVKADGKDPYVLDPYGKTSHFIWRDPDHILAWASHPFHGEKFYLYTDRTTDVQVVGPDVMTVNGHVTYLAGHKWLLNDTYPDKERNQNPYLYELNTGKRVPLGHFHSPPEYKDEFRCDLHPRSSPDGKKVIIDSPHAGTGRQMYLIDIRSIVS
jgi:hypothetical protein